MKKIIEKIKKNKFELIILSIIIIVGIFLRTYNFHDWLEFRGDQSRDAYLADQVISGKSSWPLTGPFMSYSGDGDHVETNSFHMGPIYYYFQIISAKIFGNYPDRLAYPDVFFSILSIPLFYFFLRTYFGKNLSLSLTGLYSISAYLIHYSRFAWSCNPIPFFVLLFLLSLFKFLDKNEKVPWIWVVFLGFAWGVGFQLHAITMIIFSGVIFLAFLFSMKKNYGAWKKWAVVLVIFFALNASQIVSETRTNFSNTKAFLNSSSQKRNIQGSALTLIENDIDCHIEANFLYLSSYNASFSRSNCSHDFSKFISGELIKDSSKNIKNKISLIIFLVSLVFSGVGYFLLIYYSKKEAEKSKKYFLRLLAIYCLMGFLLMLPLSRGDINDLRYFSFLFFIPFVFLGFFMKFISEKFTRKYIIMPIVIVFFLLAISDAEAISSQTAILLNKNSTCSGWATLGEIEPVVKYITSYPNEQTIYFGGNKEISVAFEPLVYLLKKQNVDAVKVRNEDELISTDGPSFYMSCGKSKKIEDVYNYEKIGHIYVYQIKDLKK